MTAPNKPQLSEEDKTKLNTFFAGLNTLGYHVLDKAGPVGLMAGGAMTASVPVWHVSYGGYCLAACGVILTDIVTGGKTGVAKLADKIFGSADKAMGVLGFGACGFLGGGSALEMVNQGTIESPEMIKFLANTTVYPMACAASFPLVRQKLENGLTRLQEWRAANDDKEPAEIREQQTSAMALSLQLSTFALGHAAIMSYGYAAGNSALQSAGVMFAGAVATLIAMVAKHSGKRAWTGNPMDELDTKGLTEQERATLDYYRAALVVGKDLEPQRPMMALG